jgi:polysaccharide pyruvyl transferase WcaK-like protein
MHILVEPSEYAYLNIGDTAMLQVAVARLSALFPHAAIHVFTHDPRGLAFYCPDAIPLTTRGRQIWLQDGYLFDRLYQLLPRSYLTEQLREVERGLRRRWPSLGKLLIRSKMKLRGTSSQDMNEYLEVISKADLVVVSGMGGITDAFPEYAFGVLDTLGLAIQRGIPTAMFGQGIGPIQDPKLKARANAVLPYVDLIALREDRAGRPLLESLGVSSDRVLTTGDDAIEIAYQSRSEQLGNGLGVNLRAASYSSVDQCLIERTRPVLQNVARKHKVPMIPIPISWGMGEADAVTIQQLTIGYDNVFDTGQPVDTQTKVIEQIRRCRVVVTGSYHAAVFALAQGIPAVGLAKSDYYVDKFVGLAELFDAGCEVIFLTDTQFPTKLELAIDRMWQSVEQLRPQLLAAAARQIQLSRAAYQRVQELVHSAK